MRDARRLGWVWARRLTKWKEGSARTPWERINLSAAGLLSPITCAGHRVHAQERNGQPIRSTDARGEGRLLCRRMKGISVLDVQLLRWERDVP